MIKYIYKYLSLLLTIICSITSAQTYPVQVVPVINSPYSNTLSDYSNPMADRLRVQLLTKDLLVNNRAARLHVKIQGNGITAQSIPMPVGVAPIYLNGGEILTLTNADLAPYFRYENLQGINTRQYSEPLPDGVYTLCFQAYDATTRKWISDNSCTTIYLKQNDPPILYQPTNFEQISSADFPNIPFSWTPRHINATNVTYNFELREVIDPSIDPRFGFEISKPLYKEEGLSTTMLVYDLSKPALISGKQYAWRVRAISTSGLSENNVFKNRGYSEIFTFTYADNCKAPAFLLSEQQAPNRVKLIWQGDNSQQKYHVQYRKANIENAEWFDTKTVNTQTFLSGLEPGTTYEFRVGALCGTISQYGTLESYSYSGLQTFTLKKDEKNIAYNCGITPSIDIANKQPLNKLIEQEEFLAGDFTVKVQEVTGSNGVFSGTGYIKVPYLFDTKIGVVFNNVSINSDHKLIDGVVETTYDPDWKNVNFVDDIITVNQQDINVNFPITNPSDISIVNGEIVVKGPNGQTETFPGGKDSVITDNAGHSYYVDENGKVTGPFQQAAGGKPTPQNTDGVDKNSNVTAITAKGVKVSFEKYTNSKYAYDKVDYKKALTGEYKEVDGEFVPFKAVANGDEEPFVAKVSISDPAIKADSIIFKTQNGVRIDAEKIGNSNDFLLKLKGAQKFAVEQVMATIKQGDKYKVAGVFNLVHITPRTVNLRLVPTEGVSISESTKEEIKKTYKQIGISLDISVDEKIFDISSYLDGGKLPTQDEMGDLSTYSPQQNAIIAAYKKERPVQQAYYLFITKAEPSTSQIGYMRLNNQFGFIFDNSARTIAHELGHGAFRLEHPFKKFKSKGLNSGNTNALMDYPAGTDFLFTDWKQVSDPKFKIYAFQKQESGELAGKTWFTPDWKPLKLKTTSTISSFTGHPKGTVPGVVYNGVSYKYQNGKYINDKNESLPPSEILNVTPSGKDEIYLYVIGNDLCNVPTYSTTYEYAIANKENVNYTDSSKVTPREVWTCPKNNVESSYQIIIQDTDKTLQQFYEDLKNTYDKAKAFYQNCNDQEWKPGKEPGIVPKCFWENSSTEDYYDVTDIVFMSGVIDGGYSELDGIVEMINLIISGKLEENITDLAYAYTLAYLECRDKDIELNKTEYRALLEKLSQAQQSTGIWSWIKEKYYEPKVENLREQIKTCEDAIQLRSDISNALTEIKEAIDSWEEIKTLTKNIKNKIAGYYNLVTSKENAGRYEAGRLVIPVASTVVPIVGQVGKASKISKAKTVLKGLEELSESKADELVEKLIVKGEGTGIIASKIYRGIKYDDFTKTFTATDEQYKIAFKLWGEEKWDELYEYFIKHDLNGGWPPFNGFYRVEKVVSGEQIKSLYPELVFDRFQTKYRGVEQSQLGGSYASPVLGSQYNQIDNVFTYDARALMDDLEEGTHYIKFRLKNTDNITFEVGEAIPWKNKKGVKTSGGAIQVKIKDRKFSDLIEGKDYDIIQQSRKSNGSWKHLIEDTREVVNKILRKPLNCN